MFLIYSAIFSIKVYVSHKLLFVYKKNIKNIEPQPKITDSYKGRKIFSGFLCFGVRNAIKILQSSTRYLFIRNINVGSRDFIVNDPVY